jgi:hypothetical protein
MDSSSKDPGSGEAESYFAHTPSDSGGETPTIEADVCGCSLAGLDVMGKSY